jgi:hypothetical protein
LCAFSRHSRPTQGRQKNGDEHANDADHDEQFYQCESASLMGLRRRPFCRNPAAKGSVSMLRQANHDRPDRPDTSLR